MSLVYNCQESLSFKWQNSFGVLKSKSFIRVIFWLMSYIMTVIIVETWKTIIISLSVQLLLFIKNECEGTINLTSLASLHCSVTAVVCSSICQLIFRTILFSNLSLSLFWCCTQRATLKFEHPRQNKIVETEPELKIPPQSVKLKVDVIVIPQTRPCTAYYFSARTKKPEDYWWCRKSLGLHQQRSNWATVCLSLPSLCLTS